MTHPVDVHVGRKLKQARTLRRLSQTDVARKLKLSFQQIQKYESGANRIAVSRLYELAQVLEVRTSWFFEGLKVSDQPNSLDLEIIKALANIKDEEMQTRIVTFIEDVSGLTVARRWIT